MPTTAMRIATSPRKTTICDNDRKRAASVSIYLEDLGVRGSRLDAYGYGESKPKSSNSTASGRQRTGASSRGFGSVAIQ